MRVPGKPIKLQSKLQLLVRVHQLVIHIHLEGVSFGSQLTVGTVYHHIPHLKWPWVLISVSLALIGDQNQR